MDVFRKALKDLEGDRDAAAAVVASLEADRYVSDARYAAAFARDKASLQGWGPVKIRFQLRGKGISDADIDAALSEVAPEVAEMRLEKLLEGKAKSLQGDPQQRLKLLKFALSRGYEYAAVEAAIKCILKRMVGP